jgi:hypothetical protein
MYGEEQFSRDVIASFPNLRGRLEENSGALHIQVGILASALRSALGLGDAEFPLQVCAFLDKTLAQPRAIPEIENALAISFVEARELRETVAGRAILTRMPERVRQILLEQERRGDAP